MFSKYYQNELGYLREMGREFAQSNPSIAALLAERGGDPDVERLLEGFAFLTARIRERVDDAVPEVAETLSQLLLPHFVRSIPAASILELTPGAGALRGRVKVGRGVEVATAPVEGTVCRFRTTADVDLVPAQVTDASLDRSSALSPILKIALQTKEAVFPAVFHADGLRFFISGEFPVAATLLLAFARSCRRVSVKSPGKEPFVLPQGSLTFPSLAPENALLPWPRYAPGGYRLLQEYFAMPAKFLFFEVRNLHQAISAAGEQFELLFELDRPVDLPPRLSKDLFRLHCTPVVNLFDNSADPIRYEGSATEHLLRASDVSPHHMEIYEVVAVNGLEAVAGGRRRYRPFFDFSHGAIDPRQGTGPSYYVVRRASSPIDSAVDTFLSLQTPLDAGLDVASDTLSIDVVCTNRGLPARLRAGDICMPTPTSPTTARYRNITAVTPPVRPALGTELHWRLISHLALAHRSLAEPGALRAQVELYNLQALAGHQDGQANQLRGESIREVELKSVRRVFQGTPIAGARTRIVCSEQNFAGRGDAFLFGCVLDDLLAAQLGINAVHELALVLEPSQVEFSWPTRSGQQPIL